MRRLLLLCLAALPLFAGSVTMTMRFDRANLTLSQSDRYDVVDLNGYPSLIQPGAPRVPRVIQSIAIPAGAVPVSVVLTGENWVTLPGTYNLAPAQPDVPLPMPGRTFTPKDYPPDPALYASSAPYPSTKIRLLGAGTMSGYRIAQVELHPVRYIAAARQLQMATSLTYRLSYNENVVTGVVPTLEQQTEFGRVVSRMVANPGAVAGFAPHAGRGRNRGQLTPFPQRKTGSCPHFFPPGHHEYVVITESPMDTVFQRLADWKTLKGVPGNVVLVSWINSNYTGYDLPEKIRNFIRDAWQNWGTIYVLLGGQGDSASSGQNIVPTRDANCFGGDYEPCDLYYAGLDGTWDADGNHVYGELDDSADMYSDVFVGRAPVYNVAMAQNFVSKVITYERNPPAGYLKKMLLPTGILWDDYDERPMQESIARMTGNGWSIGRLYERTGVLSRAAFVDSVNAGFGLGHWVGHGDRDGIYMSDGAEPVLTSNDADALSNGDKTGLAISMACDCCAWDLNPGGDCFAEHLVNRVGGGTVASIMNTRFGFGAYVNGQYVPGPSERLDTTFCSGVFSNYWHTGEALGYAKASWAPYADSGNQYDMQRYTIYDLNLIGDPETPLWTDAPTVPTVTDAGVITVGNNIPYPVTISAGGAPVESALVLLWKGSEVYTRGRTNSSGRVTLYVSATTPGSMLLSVNAHNCSVTFDTVRVVSTPRYVAHLRSCILDTTPGGNCDSILNPGETVSIPTWVKNWGRQSASTVTATFRTHDHNARVTDSTRSFGDIASGDSAYTGAAGFGLHVNPGLPDNYTIGCSLICRDANDSVWVSILNYPVGVPVLAKRSVAIKDSITGNGNCWIDPGESADVEITLKNTGLGHGYNCQAVLSSYDIRFRILQGTAAYGTIRRGDSAARRFRVLADASIPLEEAFACTLHVTADQGYVLSVPLTLVVGAFQPEDPIPDGPRTPAQYYAYDNCDTAYPEHPTYNWVEINASGTQMTFPRDDGVTMITIPSAFGPFQFYGQSFSQLSISADGWICPGNDTMGDSSNRSLPDSSTPPGMICADWDDLRLAPEGSGYVYYYHDAPNHRFIIEYDSVQYYGYHLQDKFEVVIYDSTMPTPSGDNAILVQYMTANGFHHSTLGIEDPGRQIAIQALCNSAYHRACAPLSAGRAILYVNDPPYPTGIADPAQTSGLRTQPMLLVYPNPLAGKGTVLWTVKTEGKVSLRLYDATGREIRRLVDARMKPGRYTASWDGRAGNGKNLADGVYFYKLETANGSYQQKVVVTK